MVQNLINVELYFCFPVFFSDVEFSIEPTIEYGTLTCTCSVPRHVQPVSIEISAANLTRTYAPDGSFATSFTIDIENISRNFNGAIAYCYVNTGHRKRIRAQALIQIYCKYNLIED